MADNANTGANNLSPWIEIFRAGDYRKQGKMQITREDLARVVRSYDPSFHEAPVCVGHPESNKPAYGWIGKLDLQGDVLLAQERQVDPNFAEARAAGRYKKRSASFYLGNDGKIAGLRHVAWLGAQPPEVKGLQDVHFEDNGREFLTVDFGEEETVADETQALDERIKAFFAKFMPSSSQAAAASFSEDQIKQLIAEANKPFQAEITRLTNELTAQKTQFSERETKLASNEIKQRATDAIGVLKGKGKWVPAFDKTGISLVFEELAKSSTTIEFGEGDSKQTTTPLEAFVLFMEALPAIVPTGTVVSGLQRNGAAGKTAGDPLTDKARERQKEKNISFSEALDQVAAEFPALTRVGAGTAGSV
jgi:hypothetical protein